MRTLTIATLLLASCAPHYDRAFVADALHEAKDRTWALSHGCQANPGACNVERVIRDAGQAWRAIDRAERELRR